MGTLEKVVVSRQGIPTGSPDRVSRQSLPTGSPDRVSRQGFPTGSPDRVSRQGLPTGSPDRVSRQGLPTGHQGAGAGVSPGGCPKGRLQFTIITGRPQGRCTDQRGSEASEQPARPLGLLESSTSEQPALRAVFGAHTLSSSTGVPLRHGRRGRAPRGGVAQSGRRRP